MCIVYLCCLCFLPTVYYLHKQGNIPYTPGLNNETESNRGPIVSSDTSSRRLPSVLVISVITCQNSILRLIHRRVLLHLSQTVTDVASYALGHMVAIYKGVFPGDN